MNSVETQPEPAKVQHRRIGVNFLSLAGISMFQRVLGLVSGVYLRRTLQVTGIGQLNWASSVLSYFSLAVDPGFQIIAQREVARDHSVAARYVSLTVATELVMATLSIGVIGVIASLHLREPVVNNLLMLQAVGLLLMPVDIAWLLYARERMAVVAASEFAQQVVQVICLFALVHDPSHVYRYVLIPYPTRIATAAFRMWYAARHGFVSLRDLKWTLKGGLSLFKQAAPLGLSQVAITLYYNCDAILLGLYKGEAAVGIYGTAYSLMLVSISISGSLTAAYAPSLARHSGDPQAFSNLANELLETLCWFGLPIAALGWATGRGAVQLLYGNSFAASGPIFEALCLNIAFVYFSVGVGQPSIALGRQKEIFYATTAAAISNLALNLWLIPRYGMWAAVATTMLSECLVSVVICTLHRGFVKITFSRTVLPSLITATAIGLLARFGVSQLNLPWWLCAGAGGLAAALCAFRLAHSAFIEKIGARFSSVIGMRLTRPRP